MSSNHPLRHPSSFYSANMLLVKQVEARQIASLGPFSCIDGTHSQSHLASPGSSNTSELSSNETCGLFMGSHNSIGGVSLYTTVSPRPGTSILGVDPHQAHFEFNTNHFLHSLKLPWDSPDWPHPCLTNAIYLFTSYFLFTFCSSPHTCESRAWYYHLLFLHSHLHPFLLQKITFSCFSHVIAWIVWCLPCAINFNGHIGHSLSLYFCLIAHEERIKFCCMLGFFDGILTKNWSKSWILCICMDPDRVQLYVRIFICVLDMI